MNPSDRPCWHCGGPCKRVGFTRSYDRRRIIGVIFECLTCRFDFKPAFPEPGAVRQGKRRFTLPFGETR